MMIYLVEVEAIYKLIIFYTNTKYKYLLSITYNLLLFVKMVFSSKSIHSLEKETFYKCNFFMLLCFSN